MLVDPRAAAFYGCLDVIRRLAIIHHGSLNYIVENVPGAARCHEVVDALGTPLRARAHEVGSTARRYTVICTNVQPLTELHDHYMQSQRVPLSLAEHLDAHAFSPEWRAPPHLAHGMFSKFVSRRGSYTYRMATPTAHHDARPGQSMLLRRGVPTEPFEYIVAVSLGFPQNTLSEFPPNPRRRMLGSCVDANIGR